MKKKNVTLTVTEEEQMILSDGILSLINSVNQARILLNGRGGCNEVLDTYAQQLKTLNDKILGA